MGKKKTDAQVVAHLKRHAPHILEGEIDFDALVTKVISADPGCVGLITKRRKPKPKAKPNAKGVAPSKRSHHQ